MRERPFRSTEPSRNQRLQDPVWGMITTCWSDGPEQRHELSVGHRVFSKSGEFEVFDPPGSTCHSPFDFTAPVKRAGVTRAKLRYIHAQSNPREPTSATGLFSDANLPCSSKAYVTCCNPARFKMVVWCVHEGYLTGGPVQPCFAKWSAADGGRGVEEIEKTLRSHRVQSLPQLP
jgi:hypothetical protein